jgi:glycosyltransferase involved in cell wall biosynthesis
MIGPEAAPLWIKSQQRHVLFIKEQMGVGGITTLMGNFGSRLVQDGWTVSLIARTVAPETREMLPDSIKVHELALQFKGMYFPMYARRLAVSLGLADLGLVFATDTVASWLGTILSTVLPSRPRLLCGVYTQQEFCYPPTKTFAGYGAWLRLNHFDKFVPDSAKLFQSEMVRDLHSVNYGRSLAGSSVCVLPVDGRRFANCRRVPDRHRLVSLGRLDPAKTYNLYMIDVIRSLRDKGYPVCWDVYGTGELREEMIRRIRQAGLENSIQLHGYVADDEVPRIMGSAGAFIGQGTALFEAGFCRVPSIVGVLGSESETTYGYLYELPYGVCGERILVPPEKSTTALLERLFLLSAADYEAESEKTWQYVQRYELAVVYQHLLSCFAGARSCHRPRALFAAYNLHGLYRNFVPFKETKNL